MQINKYAWLWKCFKEHRKRGQPACFPVGNSLLWENKLLCTKIWLILLMVGEFSQPLKKNMVTEDHWYMVPERDRWRTRKAFIGLIPSVHRHRPGLGGRRHPQCPHLRGLRSASRYHAPGPGGPRPHGLPHEDPHGERLFLRDHRYPAPFLVLSSAQNQTWSRARPGEKSVALCLQIILG